MALSIITNIFAGNPLDRASERRGDEAWIAEKLADAGSLAVAVWNGKPLVEDLPGEDGKPAGVQIAYLRADMAQDLAGGTERLLFLGLWKDIAVFAVDLEGAADPAEGPLQGLGRFEELRGIAASMPPADAGILATARSMFEWRRRHRWCSACGQPSEVGDAGWKRACPSCKAEHFPRTDPVAIMLAVHEDKCLLGRQAMWPAGMFSALAGFLEPGETIEEACARELKEEAGLTATSVRYHSSQPWPWPSSLMMGLIAQVDSADARPDQTELEEVRWFSKTEAAALIRGELDGAFAPPALAIAHQLIKAWVEEA
ncbi:MULTISPECIES: NAD(+) diphosphatase [unclassified Caulobacter]|uniref:NAD(+) diphosphatase n=1 Tax=unclassified Caulobacter TaxID=2648921 RepID=UPI000D33CF4B|nr:MULTISPECIES: NAD(+) diphosphatase [unclassified Caulobacter]PTS91484.1 NAD(+) diphosphatase [Caulobacter sp. HMWF009]PTT08362.1 NAD(+) diphosphatase [Caulobacter sp. HMWF025]PTT73932.1 NAD(+) diphosphatase [Pseudomonas sp. HMWF010]